VFRFFDSHSQLLAVVTEHKAHPKWMNGTTLDRVGFALHLACWVADPGVLFISTDSLPGYTQMLDALALRTVVRNLTADDLQRLAEAANPGSYFSVGLRAGAAKRSDGATYRMAAGAAVERAITRAEADGSSLGHFMARPATGERGTVGFSVAKSKLWEPGWTDDLLSYSEWCQERATELKATPSGSTLPRLHIQLAQPFATYPDLPVAVTLDPSFYVSKRLATTEDGHVQAYDLDAVATRLGADRVGLQVHRSGELLWQGECHSSGLIDAISVDRLIVEDEADGELVEFGIALIDHPLSIWFADGSCATGDSLVRGRTTIPDLPTPLLIVGAWEGTEITLEIGDGGVQDATQRFAQERAPYVLIDHGSGEIADFIAVRFDAAEVQIDLFHCKGSGGATPGRRVGDLYEVVGQTVKSAKWLSMPQWFLAEIHRRLESRTACQLVYGERDEWDALLSASRAAPATRLKATVWIVQPGVAIDDVATWTEARSLLLAAWDWCNTEGIEFRALVS